jgi:hypothetical protein
MIEFNPPKHLKLRKLKLITLKAPDPGTSDQQYLATDTDGKILAKREQHKTNTGKT